MIKHHPGQYPLNQQVWSKIFSVPNPSHGSRNDATAHLPRTKKTDMASSHSSDVTSSLEKDCVGMVAAQACEKIGQQRQRGNGGQQKRSAAAAGQRSAEAVSSDNGRSAPGARSMRAGGKKTLLLPLTCPCLGPHKFGQCWYQDLPLPRPPQVWPVLVPGPAPASAPTSSASDGTRTCPCLGPHKFGQ